jgi:hypothetical protein
MEASLILQGHPQISTNFLEKSYSSSSIDPGADIRKEAQELNLLSPILEHMKMIPE